MHVNQIVSPRCLKDLFTRVSHVTRLHREPDRLLTMLLLLLLQLQLHSLSVQPVRVITWLRGAIVHGHGEARHVVFVLFLNPCSLQNLSSLIFLIFLPTQLVDYRPEVCFAASFTAARTE